MTATWTAPRTWVANELVTASLLNTHLRDNLEWLYARRIDMLHYRDQQSSGTNAASVTAGSWQTRVLNTEVIDTGNFGALASNQITLQSGIYVGYFIVPTGANIANKARLRNVTDSTNLIEGVNDNGLNSSLGFGRFVLAAQKVLELQHYIDSTGSASGGIARSTGDNEIYSNLMLWRIGD